MSFRQEIVLPAWNIIRTDLKIKKVYLVQGVLSATILTALLSYQVIYTAVDLMGIEDKALQTILDIVESGYFIEILIVGIIFLVANMILSPIFESALIKYIQLKDNGNQEDVSFSYAIGLGIMRFLPIFEFNGAFSQLKLLSVLNAYLFGIRFIGIEYIKFLSILFSLFFIFSLFINILFCYGKYEIILQNKRFGESLSNSAKMTLLNLKLTLQTFFFIFILNFRVLFNLFIFLIFPLLIGASIAYIGSKLFLTIAIIILGIIFLALILAVGYMAGVLEIFKSSIWYYSYKKARERLVREHEIDEDK